MSGQMEKHDLDVSRVGGCIITEWCQLDTFQPGRALLMSCCRACLLAPSVLTSLINNLTETTNDKFFKNVYIIKLGENDYTK